MSDAQSSKKVRVKLTGLWKTTTGKGEMVLSGTLSKSAKLIVFPNGFKSKDSDPDYVLYIAPAESKTPEKTDATPSEQHRCDIPGLEDFGFDDLGLPL
jgi:hypothetical protein